MRYLKPSRSQATRDKVNTAFSARARTEPHHAAASRNHAGTDSRAWSQRLMVAGQKRIVRPSLKNGTRLALHQRWSVSVVTLRMVASSETLKADSERVAGNAESPPCAFPAHYVPCCQPDWPLSNLTPR